MNTRVKEQLDELAMRYNRVEFIENDPISIPHSFFDDGDVEIAAFLASVIAWGQRKSILKSGREMMTRLDNAPHSFILGASEIEIKRASKGFVYRTFNEVDFEYFLSSLSAIYKDGGLRPFFEAQYAASGDVRAVLGEFYRLFFDNRALPRTTRHISSIDKGSACKRLNMFLRWMVRRDDAGVDFGLWRGISPSSLYIPLDVHSSRQGRGLGLLTRKQNDWKAVEELTCELRLADINDPVKYDFALFGMGVAKGE